MRNLGFYGFEHSYLSRAGSKTRGKSGPLHLASVASYISNTRKTDEGIAINLPIDRSELYSELTRYSNTVQRANGRLAETFIIMFDKRMSLEHQKEALGRFMMAVTFNGEIKARGYVHTDNPENPHAHCLVVDSDDNGERVGHFGRSGTFRRENSPIKGNPTVWLRKVWQDECNAVLQEHGYDFTIDMRTKVDQQIETDEIERRERLDNHIADARNMVPDQSLPSPHPVDQLPQHAPIAVEAIEAEEGTPDDEIIDQDQPMPLPVSRRFENALADMRELRILGAKRTEAVKLQHEYKHWSAEAQAARERAEIANNVLADAKATTELAVVKMKETHFLGFRKGINFKLGPLHIRTKGIEAAIQAEASYEKAAFAEAMRGHDSREANEQANRATQKVWQIEQKVKGVEASIELHERINGQLQGFDNAEEYLKGQVEKQLKGLSPTDVLDSYDEGDIDAGEAEKLLIEMNHPELIPFIQPETPSLH